ncbi:phosphate ABC transporter substrate-binding protein [Vibrio sp. MEBiC08052]|uniref:phosphate ABC transporter substrate-binding protein n=1 Tax=Vibrio sp. MEBiC08052 TaxID=1761910 RepID=UPI0007406C84|nr:ABC transporter, periplasmic substrate-binding protein [Vibrio sp. MEBiC08052]
MLRVVIGLFLSVWVMSSQVVAKEINVSGSTSVARIMDVLAEDYNKAHPENFVAVQGVGSTAGITLLKKGVADIAMSSRYLTEGELEENLEIQLIAYDGLAVVVNLANPIKNLTRDQLYKIYKGQITNWKALGGSDQRIAVVTREASSGSRFSFESLLGLTRVVNNRLVSDINPSNLVVNSNSMVKTLVNHNPRAIGFISTGSVDQSIKAVPFEGVIASTKTISDGSYQLSRPFLVVDYSDKASQETRDFIKYLQSDRARELIHSYGYIPSIK